MKYNAENINHYHLLLAEEDDNDILHFKTALTKSGINHSIQVAKDSLQLVELINDLKPKDPDIIFIDMPRQKGLECLSRLRLTYSQKLPIFVLTNDLQDPNAAENVRKLGATGFLSKPNCISRLSALLMDILLKDWKNRCQSDFYIHFEY